MIREILLLGNTALYELSQPVTEEDKPQLKEWITDLHDTLMDFRRSYGAGRAIAAPQIGIKKRLLYMYIDKPVVFVNPTLVPLSDELFEVWDDCMSFPHIRVLVDRYKHSRIDYFDENFEPQSLELTGDLSELLQHEYDHLDGILATMRAKDEKSLRIEPAIPKRDSYRIGILGGISYTSTLVYYRRLLELYYERFRDYYYPEIVIHSLDFQRFTDYENHDPKRYIDYIAESLTLLKEADVDIALMAANSPHSVFNEVDALAIVPLISLVDAVAKEAKKLKLKNILLLGIKYTMDHGFYPDAFKKQGLTIVTPTEVEKIEVDRIIFSELAREIIRPESKQWLMSLIQRYDVDGVILGCTELPLIISQHDLDIPALNSIEIHARAAIDTVYSK